MTIGKSVAVRAATLGAWVGMSQGLGCECSCGPPLRMESGDYVISSGSDPESDPIEPEDEWLLGHTIHVDREAETATIRYIRGETTYEVYFTLL